MFFSASPVLQTGVRHSTFESLRLGRNSQSIASGFLCFWDSLNFQERQGVCGNHDSVIHEFTPVGRANHYMPSLKADSIVKVDRFEVARQFDNLQVIANTNLQLLDVVGQICSVQGSDLTKETTRVVIRLLIDP
ncbi:hypothetical protein DY000_02055740 [Brassica cretica]|uniref:Uncharacterized protein n=1 Tax=Brassica cretica TaxID=69181 RepID=A0ABQ7A7J6_BRACR|nr:hypothetical protein DY000_02055740 [Brassica cretica]